jgi:hypothetical protein
MNANAPCATAHTYRISKDDYVNAAKLAGKLTSRQALIYFVALILLLSLAAFGPAGIRAAAFNAAIGGLCVGSLTKYVVTSVISRRHYRKYKAIHDEFEVELLQDGIRMVSPNGSGKVVWGTILKWRQNESYILIYPMPMIYYLVPKSLESKGVNIALLIEKLTRHVGKAI